MRKSHHWVPARNLRGEAKILTPTIGSSPYSPLIFTTCKNPMASLQLSRKRSLRYSRSWTYRRERKSSSTGRPGVDMSGTLNVKATSRVSLRSSKSCGLTSMAIAKYPTFPIPFSVIRTGVSQPDRMTTTTQAISTCIQKAALQRPPRLTCN